MTREELFAYCAERYGTEPDYPFSSDYETAVLRHKESRRWYGIVMHIPKSRLGIPSEDTADVLNLKLPTELLGSFEADVGVYPAYHMSKLHWASILLADAPDDLVEFLLGISFDLTATPVRKKRRKDDE